MPKCHLACTGQPRQNAGLLPEAPSFPVPRTLPFKAIGTALPPSCQLPPLEMDLLLLLPPAGLASAPECADHLQRQHLPDSQHQWRATPSPLSQPRLLGLLLSHKPLGLHDLCCVLLLFEAIPIQMSPSRGKRTGLSLAGSQLHSQHRCGKPRGETGDSRGDQGLRSRWGSVD